MTNWHSRVLATLIVGLATANLHSQTPAVDGELARFQGKWRITELVDNGQAISPDTLVDLLPSGGRCEIIDNAIVFVNHVDGKKSAKSFSIDPASYPKSLAIVNNNAVESIGIYKFDSERLVVCIANPLVSVRPENFSAHAGSQRIMMVMERVSDAPSNQQVARPQPPPRAIPVSAVPGTATLPATSTASTTPAARILTDADVIAMLVGTWRLNDGAGILDVTFQPNRTFQSYRESQNISTFHNVFVQSPVGNGNWNVKQGQLVMHITASTRLDRVNQNIVFAVRSISATDLIFADQLGRVGKAVKRP